MDPEQRQEVIRLLQQGEELSPEWARILFPPEKREYELVYHGKEREEDILANTLAVPLQPVRTFGKNGDGWHNLLIFGDNLQVMKSLLEMKKAGKLCNADGTPGVRLVYIDPPFATKHEFRGNRTEGVPGQDRGGRVRRVPVATPGTYPGTLGGRWIRLRTFGPEEKSLPEGRR